MDEALIEGVGVSHNHFDGRPAIGGERLELVEGRGPGDFDQPNAGSARCRTNECRPAPPGDESPGRLELQWQGSLPAQLVIKQPAIRVNCLVYVSY
jgi:hypothetical protein